MNRQIAIQRLRSVNLIADVYESPRHNMQAILSRHAELLNDLLRRD